MIAPGSNDDPREILIPELARLRNGGMPAAGLAEPARAPAGGTPMTSSLLEIAWRSRWIIALSTLVCVSLALAYVRLATPKYTAQARLIVEQVGPKVLDATTANTNVDPTKSDTFLNAQTEFIKSTPVLDKAVETVRKNRPDAFEQVDHPVVAFLKNCLKCLDFSGGKKDSVKSVKSVDPAVGFLKTALTVTVGKKDNLISVALERPDPQDAVVIVNSVVNAYVSESAKQKRSTTVEVVKALSKEKENRNAEIEQLRKAIERFRKENPLLSAGDERGNVTTSQCLQLSAALLQAQLDVVQAKERVELFAKMRVDPQQRAKLLATAVAQGTIKVDEFLKQQIHTQELALATESKKYDEGHPKVKEIKAPLEEMRKQAREYETAMLDAYLDGVQQENNLQAKLAQTKVEKLQRDYDAELDLAKKAMAKASEYPFLKDEFDRSEKRSDVVIDRMMDLSASEDVGALNITVMESAEAGDSPTSPKKVRILGAGMVAGLMLGFGLGLLRDFRDHRLRSADEITALLELPLLGVLPHVKGKLGRSVAGQMIAARPRSEIAESFRTLRTAIYFGLPEGHAKTILVTSPSPADGKSTVASNLAIAMAQADQSVLLIEADFRNPRQKEIFGLETEAGLSGVLANDDPLDAAIVATEVKGLWVLPCGPLPPNPVEMLSSKAFRHALEELSQQYDKIIIDSPPVAPVADTRVLGALCDITLLVLRAEKSTREDSLGARDGLMSLGARILGVVVNAAPSGKRSYVYGGRIGYAGRYLGYTAPAANGRYQHDDAPSESGERSEDGGQRTEDGGQRTEDGGQSSGHGGRTSKRLAAPPNS